jgi:hypothetical protein
MPGSFQAWMATFVTSWLEGVWGEKVPADADDMPKGMWEMYRDVVVAAGRQCIARIDRVDDHVCRCVHNWTPHAEHRCACNHTWSDDTVNVYMYEDGAPL